MHIFQTRYRQGNMETDTNKLVKEPQIIGNCLINIVIILVTESTRSILEVNMMSQ